MRAPLPLIIRGGLSHTLGGLAVFSALGLLALGIYLLTDAFAHPVDAEAVGVIVAAFAIAVAMLLFIFVLKQRGLSRMLWHRKSARIAQPAADAPAELLVTAHRERMRSDLPYQRTFVDRSRIRPRTPSPAQARGIAGK